MSNIPADLKYADTHEWSRLEAGDVITIGITDYAQEELGDVVYVELPDVGRKLQAGEEMAVVESVKAASDIFAPAAGTVIEINERVDEAPQLINEDCYEDGWLVKIKLDDPSELDDLMDSESYQDQCMGDDD
ncbi:glycine cleavage system protein GcvH [Salinibius halmophilus]|uniref:glycine cleavage system protein GcvH n=1 Tax=Salinibius halmophilus TaxID=1853216 RepID=UPI000E6650A1|nr:glycine cleavage system protein GcvH [Salinibius halmophilus]